MSCFRNIMMLLSPFFVVLYFSSGVNGQIILGSLVSKEINEIHNRLPRSQSLEPQIYLYNTERWKGIRLPAGNLYGFAPENVETVYQELVNYQNHSYMECKIRTAKIETVDTESPIPVLVASVKGVQVEVERLRLETTSSEEGDQPQ